MNQLQKKWIYLMAIIIIVLFSVVVFEYYYIVYNQTIVDNTPGNGPGRGMGGYFTQNYWIFIILAIIIIAVVLIAIYFISKKVDKNIENNMKLISQIVNNNSNEKNTENDETKNYCKTVLLKFLNYNENKIVKKLIENNGSMLQSEISRMPGIGKVKSHRILKDMKIKNIVTIEQYGKTNRINLSEDVKKLFL